MVVLSQGGFRDLRKHRNHRRLCKKTKSGLTRWAFEGVHGCSRLFEAAVTNLAVRPGQRQGAPEPVQPIPDRLPLSLRHHLRTFALQCALANLWSWNTLAEEFTMIVGKKPNGKSHWKRHERIIPYEPQLFSNDNFTQAYGNFLLSTRRYRNSRRNFHR